MGYSRGDGEFSSEEPGGGWGTLGEHGLLARVVDAVANGIVVTDPSLADNPIVYVNPAFERITGYPAGEVIGRNCRFLQGDDRAQPALGEVRAAIREERDCQVVLRNFRKDGTPFWHRLTISPVRDGQGRLVRFVGVQDEITELIRAEEALRRSDRHYRDLFEGNPHPAWVYDTRTLDFLAVNDAAVREYGYSREEFLSMSVSDIRPAEDASALLQQGGDSEEVSLSGERRLLKKNGAVVEVEIVSHPTTFAGKPGRVLQATNVTERKRSGEALEASQRLLAGVMNSSLDGVMAFRAVFGDNTEVVDFEWLLANPASARIVGRAEVDLLGKRLLEEMPGNAEEGLFDQYVRVVETGRPFDHEFPYNHEGIDAWFRVTAVKLGDGFAVTFRDISEERRAEEALRESEERLRALSDAALEAIVILGDGGTVLETNRAYSEMFGYASEEVVGGSALNVVAPESHDLVRNNILSGHPGVYEAVGLRKDGSRFDMEVRGQASAYKDRTVRVAAIRDVTERKRTERLLAHRALHDHLTDLPNRTLFADRLEHALDRAGRSGGRVAVLFMDLDDFKVVNDSLGHEAGDALLLAASERLRRCVRPVDTLARFGGDEFTVLLEDVTEPAHVARVAERIIQQFRDPFVVNTQRVFTSVSIGISLGDPEHDHPEELLRQADTAMYQAKRQDRADYAVFEPAMYTRILGRVELENDLRRAIERGGFTLHYQPKVVLETGEIRGFEALLRWDHPERGLVPPDQFIWLAEETGLIIPIGRWVIEEACRQAQVWRGLRPAGDPLHVYVNLSGRQFRYPELATEVAATLRETGLEPGTLELEITESTLMDDAPTTVAILGQLKTLGVGLAIDDFGTGYSSLAYLKRFPVDILKIDRSFVDGLGKNSEDTVLVSGIIELAHALGLGVVGEGVETEDQATILREMGCDFAQGYHFAAPMREEDAVAFLARRAGVEGRGDATTGR